MKSYLKGYATYAANPALVALSECYKHLESFISGCSFQDQGEVFNADETLFTGFPASPPVPEIFF